MPVNSPTRPAPPESARAVALFAALLALLLAAAVLRLYIGSHAFGWPESDVIWVRIKRLAMGGIAGAALAVSGVALQSLLRNPLAEPFMLGLSSGAAAGYTAQWLLCDYLGRQVGSGYTGALVGALLCAALVYLGGRKRGAIDPLGLLLVGVVLNTMNGAVIQLLNSLSRNGEAGLRDNLAKWMMGYLYEGNDPSTVAVVGGVTLAGLVLLLLRGRAMDVASFSDIEAASLGVNLAALRTLLFATASALAAGAVILTGPLAFVGLVCPHLARMLLGPAHRPLLLAAAILGAILIILADIATAAIAVTWPIGILPVGIITALIGGPFFLSMLRAQMAGPPD